MKGKPKLAALLSAMRSVRLAAIAMGVAACVAAAGRAQTVDEIIAKNVKARGGAEKLKAVKTLRTTATFSQGPLRAEYKQENKRPEKVREEFVLQGLAQVQAYDGKAGWQISPFGGRKDPELMSQDDTKSLVVDADIDGPLVDYREKGHKAELVGHDSMEGTDCYKIKLSMKNGDIRYYYLDTDSFLELKIEVQTTIRGALQESENYYGDYEEVNGVYYPFSVVQVQKGSDSRAQFTVTKVEQNVAMDDAHFSMPAGKPAAKAAGGK